MDLVFQQPPSLRDTALHRSLPSLERKDVGQSLLLEYERGGR